MRLFYIRKKHNVWIIRKYGIHNSSLKEFYKDLLNRYSPKCIPIPEPCVARVMGKLWVLNSIYGEESIWLLPVSEDMLKKQTDMAKEYLRKIHK